MAERSISLRLAVRDADQALAKLRSFGVEGEAALTRLTTAAPRASAALDQVDQSAQRMSGSLRAGLGQAGFQIQDFFVQVQSGTPILTATIQQGSQLAGAFGPVGAILGTVGAVAGVVAGALLGLGRETDDAKAAAEAHDGVLRTLQGTLAATAGSADELRQKYRALSEEMQKVARLDLERAIREGNRGLIAQRGAADQALREIEDAFGGRQQLELLRREADRARALGGAQSPAAAAQLAQVEQLFATIARLRSGEGSLADTAKAIRDTLEGMRGGPALAAQFGDKLLDAARNAAKLVEELKKNEAALAVIEGRATAADEAAFGSGRSRSDPVPVRRPATEASRELERQAEAQRRAAEAKGDFIATLDREIAQSERLSEAQLRGVAAYEAEKKAIEAENRVRSAGIDLSGKEEEALIAKVRRIGDLKEAMEDRLEAERDWNGRYDAFWKNADREIEQDEREAKLGAERAQREAQAATRRAAERQAAVFSDIFATAWSDLSPWACRRCVAELVEGLT